MDDTTTVGALRRHIDDFSNARDWQRNHNPRNLAASIAIEAAELLEHFQWLEGDEVHDYVADADQRAEVAAELADVIIYALQFANETGIDISEAFYTKMARNELRFPAHLPWGSGDQLRNKE